MVSAENMAPKPTTHDFLAYRKWIFIAGGFSESKRPLYRLYQGLVFLYTVYMQGASLYGVYIAYPNKEYMLRGLHTFVVSTIFNFCICHRIIIDAQLDNLRNIVNSGIFRYLDEETNDEEQKLLENIVPEIIFKSNIWFVVLTLGVVYTLIIFPAMQYLLMSEKELIDMNQGLNPYLPYYFWSPYINTNLGFVFMIFGNIVFVLSTYNTATYQNQIFLSVNVQLRVHLEVLNHSIKNIKDRAISRYLKLHGKKLDKTDTNSLLKNEKFQDCMCASLRANVFHHLALIRFKKEFQPFVGAILFIIVACLSLLYAIMFLLILQHPTTNFFIIYIVTLVVENSYAFYQCVFGQDILDQSAELFHSLYDTPWIFCNNKFRRMLHIMMSNTIRPLKLKAYLLDFTASFETYAERYTTMYSILNVLR
nr:olfactory receptor 69 [Tropidothorax elegans]